MLCLMVLLPLLQLLPRFPVAVLECENLAFGPDMPPVPLVLPGVSVRMVLSLSVHLHRVNRLFCRRLVVSVVVPVLSVVLVVPVVVPVLWSSSSSSLEREE